MLNTTSFSEEGSVSAGASLRVVRVRTKGLSCGLHDGECNPCRLGETGATERGGDDLVVTTAGTEEIAELTMLATEAGSGIVALEAPHTSDPAFDPTMVLFKTIVQVGVGSMADRPTQHGADRPGIGAMAIGGHRSGPKPMVALADRKNALAAFMSRCSLSIASIRLPSRSIAR